MSLVKKNIPSFIFFTLLLMAQVSAQNVEELKKSKQQIQKDIELTNQLLAETRKGSRQNLNELLLIRKKIKQQESLILNIQNEISLYNKKISGMEDKISQLQKDVEALKEEYAKIIYNSYKNRHQQDKWMFIFSAKDFNEAYRRLKYLQQYSDYRKDQVTRIEEKEQEIRQTSDSLKHVLTNKQSALDQGKMIKNKLIIEKNEANKMVVQLQKEVKNLKKQLKVQKKTAARIKKNIEKIIEEERRKKLAASKEKNRLNLTPEEQLISNNFSSNKGKLPWPTERGIILSGYGEHAHPILKGIKIFNSGVDITTSEGAVVRAIFKGEVRDIWPIQGNNMAVIIKHGKYFTVYQNLIDVKVKPGDKVNTKQSIGTVFTDKNDGNKTILHLEIWKGNERNNPESWLAK